MPKITGKFLPFDTGSLTVIEAAGNANFASASSGTMTPVSASDFFNVGSYLRNVEVAWERDGGFAVLTFPYGLCTAYKIAGTADKEAEIDLTIEARLDPTVDMDSASYSWKFVSNVPI